MMCGCSLSQWWWEESDETLKYRVPQKKNNHGNEQSLWEVHFFFIGCLFGWVGVLGNSLQRCWRCKGCSKQVIYSRLSASFAFSSVHLFLLSFAVHFLFSVLGAVSVSQLPRHKSSSVYLAVFTWQSTVLCSFCNLYCVLRACFFYIQTF